MENERSVLRWGGLAGILAFIVWIVEMPLYGFVDPFTPEGLMSFTDVRAALGLSTLLMMTIAALSVALVLALYRALRGTNLAFALYGSVLGVTGYIVTALGDASTFFAFAPISDLNQAPAATPETQATAVLLWQATQGITFTFFFVGSFFMSMCFIAIGVAMLTVPVPVAAAEEPERLGDKPMYLRFRLDDGSILQMSDIGDNEAMAQGPFLVGEASATSASSLEVNEDES